jgi:hypothetical protein
MIYNSMAGSCQNSIILFVLVLHVRKDNDEVKWWWLSPHHLWVNMLDLQHVTWVSGLMGRLLLHHAVMCLCFHLIINGGTCGPLTDLIGPTALMAVYEWCTISSFAMSTQGHSHGLTSIYFKKKGFTSSLLNQKALDIILLLYHAALIWSAIISNLEIVLAVYRKILCWQSTCSERDDSTQKRTGRRMISRRPFACLVLQ